VGIRAPAFADHAVHVRIMGELPAPVKNRRYRANSAKLSRAAVNEVERSTTRLKVRLPGIGW